MSVGQLSADQQAFHDAFVAQTNLDPILVTAWIGAESGWDTTKADHNYLNVGPGQAYTDATAAATASAATLHNGRYNAVLAAADGPSQLAAIVASPWDAGHYANGTFQTIYAQLSGNPAGNGPSGTAGAVNVGFTNPLDALKGLAQAGDNIGKAAAWLANLHNIWRLIEVFAGAAFVFLGIAMVKRDAIGGAVNTATGGLA